MRLRITRRAAFAVTAPLLLVGCASGAVPPGHIAAKVVPWKAILGSKSPLVQPTPLPVPAGTRNCVARDLLGGLVATQGMTGDQLLTSVTFVNRSGTACRLEGPPGLVLVEAGGTAVGETVARPPGAGVISVLLVARRALGPPRTAAPVGDAVVDLVWSPQDLAAPGGACPTSAPAVLTMKFSFPADGGTVSVAVTPSPQPFAPCGGVKMAGFNGTVAAIPTSTPTLTARLIVPQRVASGHVLKYLLVLHNPGSEPIDLGRLCPTFAEGLSAPGFETLGFYSLNCAAAGSIGSDQQLTFAMQLQVPGNAPHRRVDVEWFPIVESTHLTVQSPPSQPIHIS